MPILSDAVRRLRDAADAERLEQMRDQLSPCKLHAALSAKIEERYLAGADFRRFVLEFSFGAQDATARRVALMMSGEDDSIESLMSALKEQAESSLRAVEQMMGIPPNTFRLQRWSVVASAGPIEMQQLLVDAQICLPREMSEEDLFVDDLPENEIGTRFESGEERLEKYRRRDADQMTS